ncbi:hypothetical protein [Glaciecola sp. 1036]|uniref:hypothetical protein n=1 Tax=Alteromonadaceae TaxID=72275 RepID=UPI003D08D0D6
MQCNVNCLLIVLVLMSFHLAAENKQEMQIFQELPVIVLDYGQECSQLSRENLFEIQLILGTGIANSAYHCFIADGESQYSAC